jgi:GNAT superfamily N-acetyltransferase
MLMSQILEHFSLAAVIQAMEINHQEALVSLLHLLFEGEEHRNTYITWFLSGLPVALFNPVMQTRFTSETPAEDIEATMRQVQVTASGLPMCWVIGPTLRQFHIERYLQTHGWSKDFTEPSLALDMQNLDMSLQYPAGLTIERVDNEASLQVYIDTFAAGFQFPEFIASKMLKRPIQHDFFQHPSFHCYLARLHGEPVATSMLFLGGGIAGIYDITTLAQARRQGIGRAITLATLYHARRMGYRFAALQASDEGLPLYQQLGFQEYCTFDTYVLPQNTKQ